MDRRLHASSAALGALLVCVLLARGVGFIELGVTPPLFALDVRSINVRSPAALGATRRAATGRPFAHRVTRPLTFVVDPATSRATYRIMESFMTLNTSQEIEGTTSAIQSEIVIDQADVRNTRVGPITIDIRTLKSDNMYRDDAIRTRWLESSKYPLAEFTPIEIRGLRGAYSRGRMLHLEIIGTLKLHGVVRPARFAMQVKWQGSMLTGHAASTLCLTDFGIRPPSLGVIRVSNQAKVEIQFSARLVDPDLSAHARGSRRFSKPAASTTRRMPIGVATLGASGGVSCGTEFAVESASHECGVPGALSAAGVLGE
ncbi:MAG TPA: YceI family protein [bacterium]|nr:YceI family protein [bacterium]